MENKTSYPVKKSFCISRLKMPKHVMAFLLFIVAIPTFAQPTACFTMNTNQVCPGDPVTFTDCSGISNGSGWLFIGDGTTTGFALENLASATYTYTTPGIYNPRHLINDGSGNNFSPTQTLTVVDNTPIPTFVPKICEGNLVTIEITDSHYDIYDINWGDGEPHSTATPGPGGAVTHPYAAQSTYTITVTGAFTSASCTSTTPASVQVTTINTLMAPVFEDLTIHDKQANDGSGTLRFSTLTTQKYALDEQLGAGGYNEKTAFSPFQGAGGTQSLTFTDLHTTEPYYYRLYAFDGCGNTAYSDEIYAAAINGTASNRQNTITWFDYHTWFPVSNFVQYDLLRDGVPIISYNEMSPPPFVTFDPVFYTYTYVDNDPTLICQQAYKYQIRTTTTTGLAYSAEIYVTAISTDTPPTVENPNVTVVGGQTLVEWTYPTLSPSDLGFTPSSSSIERTVDGQPYSIAGTSPGGVGQFYDNGSSPNSSEMCYRISYTDVCGNTSATSAVTCPVLLTMSSTTTDNNLTWTSYSGYYTNGISTYVVEVLDENGSVIRTVPLTTTFSASDPIDASASIMRYRIRVEANAGIETFVSLSNIVEISFAPQLHVPTAFTPNADGTNDKFQVKGRYIKSFEMTVYNQWGQAVFFSQDPDRGWDGTFNGESCIVDDYAWIVKAKDNSGKDVVEKGTVSLIR